jgi:hypothetical protein
MAMNKRKLLLCSLLILLTAFSNLAFAASTPPYASIVAYNENQINGNNPNVSTLGVLDIINMTPWNISIGPSKGTQIFAGMTTAPWESMWLAGFNYNNQTWTPPPAGQGPPSIGGLGGSFAFHSYQVALNNLNNVWQMSNKLNGYSGGLFYDTVPIVFGSTTFTQGSQPAVLNFSATSTEGFCMTYFMGTMQDMFPATALSYGDGTYNYGWDTFSMVPGNIYGKNTTHFLTIQGAGTNAGVWQPIATKLGGVTPNKGTDGPAPGTIVQSPNLLNVAGLVFPNFSTVAGDAQKLDLIVILQAGGYGDMQLLFLAVPNGNDSFLPGVAAVRK